MSTGYSWEGIRQVRATLLGARHVPERLCGGRVYLGRYIKCSTFTFTFTFETQECQLSNNGLWWVVLAVRFLFTDNARMTTLVGEKFVVGMIGTLCDALESEYGVLIPRLYRIFKPLRGLYTYQMSVISLSLSLLQAVDRSGKGSATRVLLHSARFSASSTLSCKSSMLCLTTSIHLFVSLPLLRYPPTFASKIRLTQ